MEKRVHTKDNMKRSSASIEWSYEKIQRQKSDREK